MIPLMMAGTGLSRSRAFRAAPSDGGTVTLTEDPYYYNNALLVTFHGSNGSTSFTDNSRYAHTLTSNGGAAILSNKLDLDGTDDYVSIPDHMAWTPGSRMSWELWGVEFDDTSAQQCLISHNGGTLAGHQSWRLMYNNTAGRLSFVHSAGGATSTEIDLAAFTPVGTTGYDIAFTWDGATIRLYVNGIFKGSGAFAGPFFNSPQLLRIGCDYIASSGPTRYHFNGRIEAIRITRGIDRAGGSAVSYVRHALALATVSTSLTDSDWANVILLLETLDDGTIRDASPYDWPMVVNGNAAVSTSIEPFINANSLALDGTGDYVVISDDAILEFGSGDFTIETFARHSVNTTIQHYVTKWLGTGGPNQRSWALRYRGDAATDIIDMPMSANGSTTTTTVQSGAWTPTVGTFYHVAMSRSGNNKRIFIDGTQSGSTNTTAVTPFDSTAGLLIGEITSGSQTMNGYLSEMRITKGTARYTSNFTAPSAQFPRG